MAANYRLRYLDEGEFERWDRFVDESDQGSIYSKSYFLRALCNAACTQFRILTAWKGQEIFGGVGLHFKKSRYGYDVHRRGLLYYNGLVLKNFETKYPSKLIDKHNEILRVMLEELENRMYAVVQLSNRHTLRDTRVFTWNGWGVWPQYTYEVPIHDLDKLWDRAEQNVRRLITRCEQEGMKLRIDDDFAAFYALHKVTYERKGLSPYLSLERFRMLYEALKAKNCCQIFFAVSPEGKPLAVQIVLFTNHPVTHTWAAGADPDYLRTGASAFLRWKVFEELNKRGFAYNDLTDAMEEKVAKFKSQFGGNLVFCPIIHRVNSPLLRVHNRIHDNLVRPFSYMMNKLSNLKKREDNGAD